MFRSPSGGRRIENLGQPQKEDLFRHREQFLALPPGEQQRIRQLQEQLQNEPDGQELRAVMRRYCQWLATLPSYRRDEVLELKPAERIAAIKQMLKQQAKLGGRPLSEKDCAAVVGWIEHYAAEHEARVLETLPENRRHAAAKPTPAARHRLAVWAVCKRWSMPGAHPPTTDQELADLRGRLSPEALARLEAKPSAEQPRVMTGWIRQAAEHWLAVRRREGGGLFGLDELLADYFEFQLTPEQRDGLMSLPDEEMRQKLHEMFLMQWKPGEGLPHRGEHGWRGRKPPPAELRPKTDQPRPTAEKERPRETLKLPAPPAK